MCRIYNKLPEVTKKKEEEKRRLVSQTNRLRAELFKKVWMVLGLAHMDAHMDTQTHTGGSVVPLTLVVQQES